MFFENYQIDKSSKIGITNLLSNITTREGSHKGGWTRLLKCQLVNIGFTNVKILDNKESLSDYDVIIFDLGAEYSGTLNLFGGLDNKVFKRLQEIREFTGEFYSWKNELPSLKVLESRKNNQSTCQEFKNAPDSFLNDVVRSLLGVKIFEHVYRTSKILIGDSHAPSVWTPEYGLIERRDGRTLRGMIDRKTIHKIVNENLRFNGFDINEVQIHCGSIDIRHHAMREKDSFEYVEKLGLNLLDHLSNLHDDCKLVVTHTMGIEDESRKLPKTGYYKGTPFYGSWENRNKCRQIFNDIMDQFYKLNLNTEVVKFPEYFFDDADKLKFEVMETPGSVHLSPEHYRWDLNKNVKRW